MKTSSLSRWVAIVCIQVAFAALSGFAVHTCLAADGAKGFDRKAWQEDYARLKQELERRDANLAWFASPQGGIDIPALDRRTRRALASAEDDADAKAALLGFVGGFHGHFSQLPSLQPATAAAAKEPAQPAFDKLGAATGCAALGYGATHGVPFSLPFETLPGFALESDGVTRAFRAGVVASANGTPIGIVRIRHFRQHEDPAPCLQHWTDRAASQKGFDADAFQDRIDVEWYAALAAQLHRFRTQGVAAVIVDLGGNTGGNDSGDAAARLFSPRPIHSARVMINVASAPAYFDAALDDLRKAQRGYAKTGSVVPSALMQTIADFERRKAGVVAAHCDMSWVWRERHPWNRAGCNDWVEAGFASGAIDYLPAGALKDAKLAQMLYWPAVVDPYLGSWSGPVYVLTNGRTYSSAEMFTAVLHDNGIARTVGTATGGDGCGFMQDEDPIVLPHSHLRFRMPDCVRLRADGTDEVAGIEPDLPLLPMQGESDCARAARALEAIAADLRKGKSAH